MLEGDAPPAPSPLSQIAALTLLAPPPSPSPNKLSTPLCHDVISCSTPTNCMLMTCTIIIMCKSISILYHTYQLSLPHWEYPAKTTAFPVSRYNCVFPGLSFFSDLSFFISNNNSKLIIVAQFRVWPWYCHITHSY